MNQRLLDRYNQLQADQTRFRPDDILIHTHEGIEQEVNFRGPYKTIPHPDGERNYF